MSTTSAAIILFATMWVGLLYWGYRLFSWLFRVDRDNLAGKAPYDHGL